MWVMLFIFVLLTVRCSFLLKNLIQKCFNVYIYRKQGLFCFFTTVSLLPGCCIMTESVTDVCVNFLILLFFDIVHCCFHCRSYCTLVNCFYHFHSLV